MHILGYAIKACCSASMMLKATSNVFVLHFLLLVYIAKAGTCYLSSRSQCMVLFEANCLHICTAAAHGRRQSLPSCLF